MAAYLDSSAGTNAVVERARQQHDRARGHGVLEA